MAHILFKPDEVIQLCTALWAKDDYMRPQPQLDRVWKLRYVAVVAKKRERLVALDTQDICDLEIEL